MSPATTHAARYSILLLDLHGDVTNAGILLEDPGSDRLYIRLRRDWDRIAPEEADVLSTLESDLESRLSSFLRASSTQDNGAHALNL